MLGSRPLSVWVFFSEQQTSELFWVVQLFMLGSSFFSYSECVSILFRTADLWVILSASVIYAGQQTSGLFWVIQLLMQDNRLLSYFEIFI